MLRPFLCNESNLGWQEPYKVHFVEHFPDLSVRRVFVKTFVRIRPCSLRIDALGSSTFFFSAHPQWPTPTIPTQQIVRCSTPFLPQTSRGPSGTIRYQDQNISKTLELWGCQLELACLCDQVRVVRIDVLNAILHLKKILATCLLMVLYGKQCQLRACRTISWPVLAGQFMSIPLG